MRMMKPKLFPMLALMLVMGAFLFAGTAYAADPTGITVETETLSVDDVWLVGEMLNIVVTDKLTGLNQTLELNLRDYAGVGDEYVTIQAVDRAGNISNSIQFRNPFYIPAAQPQQPDPESDGSPDSSEPSEPSEPGGTTNTQRPFTPDGTGTVVDNVTDGDGKEFFSISTEDGNIFYLIVDRQRNVDNVYLLNAVTEYDLMSLAQPGDGRPASPSPEPPPGAPSLPEPPTDEPEPTPAPAPEQSGGNSSLIFIIIAVIVVGGAGYYFKIVRPKQSGGDYDDYDDEQDSFDDDSEIEHDSDDDERGDDE